MNEPDGYTFGVNSKGERIRIWHFPKDPEPIHSWFNLTYSNYLVMPRAILQSMPVEWQQKFVDLLHEWDERAKKQPWPKGGYLVHARDERGRFVADKIPYYNRGRTVVKLREDGRKA